MLQEIFLVNNKSGRLKLEKDFVIEEIRVIDNEHEENTHLFYQPSSFVAPVFTFVPRKLETVRIRALLEARTSHVFYTDNSSVEIRGTYTTSDAVNEHDTFILRRIYFRRLTHDEFTIIKEDFDIEFFSSRVEDSECIQRTSLVVEINGKDATLCTLSWGLCVNGLFKYKYRAGEELTLRILGPGSVVLAGAQRPSLPLMGGKEKYVEKYFNKQRRMKYREHLFEEIIKAEKAQREARSPPEGDQ
ncbi:UNVERIFIED_CONTAM: hypothetical protein PYX00_011699 [Menopon gallinae]|uniref:Uncharacterized protein n=1 Tax=Menopon gallinae TaxID=328185 RepID=A0AAW2H854_9NEOP